MLIKEIARVVLEAIAGLCLAGVLLAVVVPLSIERGWIVEGQWSGAALIGATLIATLCAVVLRRASARRRHRHD